MTDSNPNEEIVGKLTNPDADSDTTDEIKAPALVRVYVDDDACIGAGMCEMHDPDVFVVDDDEVISKVIGEGLMVRERAVEAADRCPGRAISFVEAEPAT